MEPADAAPQSGTEHAGDPSWASEITSLTPFRLQAALTKPFEEGPKRLGLRRSDADDLSPTLGVYRDGHYRRD